MKYVCDCTNVFNGVKGQIEVDACSLEDANQIIWNKYPFLFCGSVKNDNGDFILNCCYEAILLQLGYINDYVGFLKLVKERNGILVDKRIQSEVDRWLKVLKHFQK